MLVKVYDVLPFSMNGRWGIHVLNHSGMCQHAGSLGVLLVLASLARTSRSRRLGERRKATTGASLKMIFKRSVECRIGCFLRSISWMLGKAGLYVIVKGTRSDVSFEASFCSFKASFRGICWALEICSAWMKRRLYPRLVKYVCSSAEPCLKNSSVELNMA